MKNLSNWYHHVLVFLSLFIGLGINAQELEISGTITGEDGEPLPGVNVVLKGTTEGVISDLNGNFSLSVPDNSVLVVSFIGYLTEEIAISTEQNNFKISLIPDLVGLDEIVVIGYGTVTKKDLTGSISSLKPKDFNKGVSVAPEQLIQGKIAGVDIVQNNGAPGSASTVRIRGSSSISAGNNPLYVVDGVPLQFGTSNEFVPSSSAVGSSSAFSSEGTNPLNVINPSDIESIEVLKDASAAAIYGSRGANGVIIITTKSKKEGKESIAYDTYFSWSKIRKTMPVLTASEYIDYAESDSLLYPNEGADTDWQNEIFKTAFGQNHNLSFASGSKNSNYRASLGYNEQEGIIISNKLKKYTGRINANQTGLDGKLKVGINLTYAKINEDNTPISSNINNEGGNILKDAIRWAPTLPVYNEDGTYYQIGELRINPVSWQDVEDERNTNLFLGNARVSYDILNSLNVSVNLGHSDAGVERYTNVPGTHPAGETEGGRASINKNKNTTSMIETNLKYHKTINNLHGINILAGYSYQTFQQAYTFTAANHFVSSATKWNLMQSGTMQENTSYKTENLLSSIYGRINYKYAGRYLVTLTLRNDGSSRFGENKKWGLFPSGAFAWNITEEEFFNVAAIDNLKLRLGYGITGNQEIPNDLYREQLSVSGSSIYYLGGQAVPSVLPSNFANKDISWEETTQSNFGIDYSVLEGRLSGSIDYYIKKTTDLLLQFSTAAPSVVTTQWANVGEVSNKGIELMLDAKIIRNQDFQWNSMAVISSNRNEVVTLSNEQFSRDEIRTSPTSGVISNGTSTQIIRPGLSLGTFYGRKFLGYDEEGMETYLDLDKDGEADEVEIGCAMPDFSIGFTNTFYYNNFDLSLTLRGVFGNDVYNNTVAEFSYKNAAPGTNVLESAINPAVSRDQIAQFSSQWIEDASYLRLDNLSIGYTFDVQDISFLSRARIYVTGQNLFVITGYTGFDPEVRTNTNRANTAAEGIDYLAYPRPRVLMIGANIAF